METIRALWRAGGRALLSDDRMRGLLRWRVQGADTAQSGCVRASDAASATTVMIFVYVDRADSMDTHGRGRHQRCRYAVGAVTAACHLI